METYSADDKSLKDRIERDLRIRLTPEITSHLKVVIEPFLDSNVTIDFQNHTYICKFCLMLGLPLIADQYQPTIDYTVNFVAEHNNKLPPSHKAGFSAITGGQKFVFLFAPDCIVDADDDFVRRLCPKILPETPNMDIAWVICILQGSDEHRNAFCRNVIERWQAAQVEPDSIKYDSKTVKVGSTGVECVCVIAYRVVEQKSQDIRQSCTVCGSVLHHLGCTEKDALAAANLKVIQKDEAAFEFFIRSIGGKCQECGTIVCQFCYSKNGKRCSKCNAGLLHFGAPATKGAKKEGEKPFWKVWRTGNSENR